MPGAARRKNWLHGLRVVNSKLEKYEDQAGFCKVATLQDIKDNDYVLTPGRYVGAAEQEEDGVAV